MITLIRRLRYLHKSPHENFLRVDCRHLHRRRLEPADLRRSYRHESVLFQTRTSKEMTVNCRRINFEDRVNLSTSTHVLSSTTSEIDDETEDNVEIDSSDTEEGTSYTIGGETSDEDLEHLRIKLYPVDENASDVVGKTMLRLYEAASIQQVFDILEEYEKSNGEIDIKIASQALVTIWDLQKFLFKISTHFDPERDYFDRPSFIEKLSNHPSFRETVVKPVVEKCSEMEDEPLTATLLCLKKLNFKMKSPEIQKFIEECLKRKDTLALASLSRLNVCLRDEGLYGNYICSEFHPLLWKYVDSISSDVDVRLMAITFKNSLNIISDALLQKFVAKIDELQVKFPKFENVTLCKIFLVLMQCRNDSEAKRVCDLVGEALIPRIPTIQLMDLLSLQKFLELGINQPYGLVEALTKKMFSTVQEAVSTSSSPRLDLIASIAPYMKSVEQRRQMALMLKEYLDTQFFDLASGILFTMLRWARTNDFKLCDQFWKQAETMVKSRWLKDSPTDVDRRTLRLAKDYVNFCYGLNFAYRHKDFEHTLKGYLLWLIDNYKENKKPCIYAPNEFAKAYCLLIGMANLNDRIFSDIEMIKILDDFAPQFRPTDLSFIARGLESVVQHLFNTRHPPSRFYDRIIEIGSIIEEQCSRIIFDKDYANNLNEMLTIHKVALVTRRVKGETPILEQSLKRVINCEINDTRAVKDISQVLLIGLNKDPVAVNAMFDVMWKFKDKPIHPEVVEKFVCAAFTLGVELDEGVQQDVIDSCSVRIAENWDKLSVLGLLQASIGLCYYKRLPKELVQNIFSVEFLDQIDNELKALFHGRHYSLKVRQALMDLNRAVCINMPDCNLPWFHGKYCEEQLSLKSPERTYLHDEIYSTLVNIVGDEAAVQSNVCTPYFYVLDFLVQFDQKGIPIKKKMKKSSSFFRRIQEPETEPKRKVALLLLNDKKDFTRNDRTVKGMIKLKRVQLEILGYNVIEIDPRYWNSMFMSDNYMRQRFVELKLYANARANG